VRTDAPQPHVTLLLRNAPAANRVTLAAGAWHEELQLNPGEERRVEMPLDASTGIAVLRIRSESGFRPADADPKSRDTRFLGVFVRVE
jgi:hypothetical protein